MHMACGLLAPVLALALSQGSADPSAFFGGQVPHRFFAEWFSGALTRMKEPSLAASAGKGRTFRCTVLPTWGNPVSARLSLEGDAGTVLGRRLGGFGGYEMRELREQAPRLVEAAQVTEFLALFGRLGFRKLPYDDGTLGFDGSEWILEEGAAGEYHVVARWSPARRIREPGVASFVEVCAWLCRASGLAGNVTNKGSIEIAGRAAGTR